MQIIKEVIEQVVGELGLPAVSPSAGSGLKFVVEHPKDESNGDWSSNVAMVLAKSQGKNPREIAESIVGEINKVTNLVEIVEKIEVAGAGFINFTLKQEHLWKRVGEVMQDGYGSSESGKGKTVIVEYSSPNIAKPFTVGHLRSTVIGDAVANLLEMNGWRVLRDNHLGDWGTQFGKQIVAIKRWGDLDLIEKAENPVKELVELYVRFHKEAEEDESLVDEARAWFRKLEDGDKEARELWSKCVEWSWKEFSRIYELLGVKHSDEFQNGRGLGEAFFEDKMGVVVEALEKKKILKEGERGAKLVFFPDDKYPPAMILKGDGATLYHTRDLATDKYRLDEYKPDLIINEVGAEQTMYFRQLYEIEQMLGWYDDAQRVHIAHGMIRFADGKMSTRRGNVIWLNEVLTEAIKRAGEMQKDPTSPTASLGASELAKMVGIGALKWNDLKGESKREMVFDWDEILNMKGDSGPYVQYTFARAMSVGRRVGVSASQKISESVSQLSEEELSIARWLDRYPELVHEAGERYAPHMVAGYVYELATRFNTFYNKHQIVGSDEEGERVELTRAVASVIESGLGILGIEAPKEM